MVETLKISEMTDAGDFVLGLTVPALESGANVKTLTQLQFSATGNTATRPVSPATPTIRYNTDFEQFEYWDGTVWGQLGADSDVAALIARLAAHTAGNGASMIGLLNQGSVSNKTVQDLANADFIVKTTTSSLFAGFALSSLSTGFVSVQTGTGNLISRTLTGSTNQIDISNGTGLSGNPQVSIAANPQLSGNSNLLIPSGTTAQRPIIPLDGMIRYNIDDNVFEWYNGNALAWEQGASTGGAVASVSGTANRVTSTGGVNPIIDISASYVGQSSITTLGTIVTGVWQGTVVGATYGGTGINNGSSTITLGGSILTAAAHTLSGAFASTFTFTGITGVTFPTTGTLATTSQIPTGTALTKTDDTNVTLTLGGSPATALVNAASLTLGWTGTLSGTRGGTGVNNGASTITLGGSLTTSGAFSSTFTMTGATNVTFPTSGTLATTAGTVSSVSGTTNRITSTGGTTPVIDISASYVGQSSITTLGTITTGVWTGTTIAIANGGTAKTSVTTAPAATSWAGWDANSNLSAVNHIEGYTSITSAAGTTTLVVGSNYIQQVVGSTTQTIQMPVTSTLVAGQSWQIINNSTGVVTVNSSGSNLIISLQPNTAAIVTCILASGTTAASWTSSFSQSGGGSGIIDAWVQYTPTFTGFGTAASINIWSRRVGGDLEVRGTFTAGTTTSTEARISLGYNGVDGAVTSSSTVISAAIQLTGTLIQGTNTASSFYMLIEQSKTYMTMSVQNGTNNAFTKTNGNTFTTGSLMSFNATIPISGWS